MSSLGTWRRRDPEKRTRFGDHQETANRRIGLSGRGIIARSFHNRAQDDVSIIHAGVIALKIDGAGTEFIRPQRASRAAEHGLVVDGFPAVVNHCQGTVPYSELEGMPFGAM